MSQSAVINYLETRLNTLAGTVFASRARRGEPEPLPYSEAPFVILEAAPPTILFGTFGVSGTVFPTYTVDLRIILGGADMVPAVAAQRRAGIAEALRALLTPDWTLGGTCWNCDLLAGLDNTQRAAYRTLGTAPEIGFRLQVQEQTAANAGA